MNHTRSVTNLSVPQITYHLMSRVLCDGVQARFCQERENALGGT
jgi:hypothetical protein